MAATKTFKFDVKANADAAGQFAGRASVYGVVDAYNDVVMPGAFRQTLEEHHGEIVVLNQHDPTDPIGRATLTDTDLALMAEGVLVMDLQSARDAYVRLQNRLIDGMSIGYEVVKDSYVGGVRQLQEIKLWEISLCTFPANEYARVTNVKAQLGSLEHELKAGRVLSDANRKKIQSAHEAMQGASALLKELLDLTDPNIDADKAQALLVAVKRQQLALKASQDVYDSLSLVSGLIDALGQAYDQLVIAIDAESQTQASKRRHLEPDTKGVIAFQDLPLADLAHSWDRSAADSRVREWAGATDAPNERYRRAFVWYEADHADTFGAYKLQIGDIVDGKLVGVPKGIFAVAAVLQGSRGGVDIPESDQEKAKAHIGRYYKKLDRTAPWDEGKSLAALLETMRHMRGLAAAQAN